MNKKIVTFIGLLIILMPFSVAQALSSEIHVTKDGKAAVGNVKVMQIAGNTFFSRLYWGDSFVRLTIRTNASTKFFRATGEATTINEISVEDLLDASGELASQSDTLTLNASSIRNSSVQKEQSIISGTVTGIAHALGQFTVNDRNRGLVTIITSTTTQYSKGSRTLDLAHIHIGDLIAKAAGDYDIPSKTLTATSVVTYIDLSLYKPRLFIGKLLENPSSATASSLRVAANGAQFTVFLGGDTEILRNNRSSTTLQRFVAGDAIRLYGTRRESDEPEIDAEVIRNTNL